MIFDPTTDELRSLCLTPPWGTAMALGLKTVETRSWKTPYRGWVAIQQTKAFPAWARGTADAKGIWVSKCPLSAIVCVGRLVAVEPTSWLEPRLTDAEKAWGDYSPGRYGLIFVDVQALAVPFPFVGHQGLRRVDQILAAEIARRAYTPVRG